MSQILTPVIHIVGFSQQAGKVKRLSFYRVCIPELLPTEEFQIFLVSLLVNFRGIPPSPSRKFVNQAIDKTMTGQGNRCSFVIQ